MNSTVPLRILVVEDEALIMMATLDMLDELGHDTRRARNAATAIASLENDGPVDVVLTDINLPDMDGQALVAEVRRRFPQMPVVFATGYRMPLSDAVTAGGPTAVLTKPYLPKELAAALIEVRPASQAGSA